MPVILSIFKGRWAAGLRYAVGDAVFAPGGIYRSRRNHLSSRVRAPQSRPTFWEFVPNFRSNYRGVWVLGASYTAGDVVVAPTGLAYVATQDLVSNRVNTPQATPASWELVPNLRTSCRCPVGGGSGSGDGSGTGGSGSGGGSGVECIGCDTEPFDYTTAKAILSFDIVTATCHDGEVFPPDPETELDIEGDVVLDYLGLSGGYHIYSKTVGDLTFTVQYQPGSPANVRMNIYKALPPVEGYSDPNITIDCTTTGDRCEAIGTDLTGFSTPYGVCDATGFMRARLCESVVGGSP